MVQLGFGADIPSRKDKKIGELLEQIEPEEGRFDFSFVDTLLLEARAAAINLLVVGGYSRSRLRELMFGGVTGHLLAESDIPVFMVH